jgi:hypothetical protein
MTSSTRTFVTDTKFIVNERMKLGSLPTHETYSRGFRIPHLST